METTGPPAVPGVELGALLGRGGGGEVWEGCRVADGRRVAVKVSRGDAATAEAAVREAAVSARMAAEHVLGVESCTALPGGRVALVMPLMRGGSLARLVRARGHLSPGEVVTVLAPLAGALGRLHAAGVVHGDVSPGNVLLDLDGRPVLADLGVGRVVGDAPAPVWGTPGHTAPEVLIGAEPSPAADVYALGALGWLCLAGEVPGPPGLRPALAEVSLAGPGAEGVLAAVEAAVRPSAEERPGADELAVLLFGAAEPEPLHLVVGDDDASAVTYRLRAAAGRPPERGKATGGRHRRGPGAPAPRPRAVMRLADRLGTPTRGRPGAVTARGLEALTRRRWLAVAAVVLAGGVGLLAGPGASALRDDPTGAGRAVPPSASVSASASAPAATAPPATAPVAAPAPARAPVPADPRSDPRAPRTDATNLLVALAAERARAYREADPGPLAASESAGGELYARDRAAVEALRASGLRYAGLEYVVEEVAVVTASDTRAVLRARLGVAPYRVAGADEEVPNPGSAAAPVLVDLVRGGEGWRVTALRDG